MTTNATEDYARTLMRMAVAKMCQNLGFQVSQTSCLDVMGDVTRRLVETIFAQLRDVTEHGGRTEPTPADLQVVFDRHHLCIGELHDYLQQVPEFPVRAAKPRPVFPPVSEKELAERPSHIPRHFPPIHPEWVASDVPVALGVTNGFLVDEEPNTSTAYEQATSVDAKKARLPNFADLDASTLGLLRTRSPIPQRPVTPVVIVPPPASLAVETAKAIPVAATSVKVKKKHETNELHTTPPLFSVDTNAITVSRSAEKREKEKKKKKKLRSPPPDVPNAPLATPSTSNAVATEDGNARTRVATADASEKTNKWKTPKFKGKLIEDISKSLTLKQKKAKQTTMQHLFGTSANLATNEESLRPAAMRDQHGKVQPLRLKPIEGRLAFESVAVAARNEKDKKAVTSLMDVMAARLDTNPAIATASPPPPRLSESLSDGLSRPAIPATPSSSPPKLKIRRVIDPSKRKTHSHRHRHKEKKLKRTGREMNIKGGEERKELAVGEREGAVAVGEPQAAARAEAPPSAVVATEDTRKIKMIFSVKQGEQAFSAFSKDSVPMTPAVHVVVNSAAFVGAAPSSPSIPPDANAETPPALFGAEDAETQAFTRRDGDAITPPAIAADFATCISVASAPGSRMEAQPRSYSVDEQTAGGDQGDRGGKEKKAKKKEKERNRHHKKSRQDHQGDHHGQQRNGAVLAAARGCEDAPRVPKIKIKLPSSPPTSDTAMSGPIRMKIRAPRDGQPILSASPPFAAESQRRSPPARNESTANIATPAIAQSTTTQPAVTSDTRTSPSRSAAETSSAARSRGESAESVGKTKAEVKTTSQAGKSSNAVVPATTPSASRYGNSTPSASSATWLTTSMPAKKKPVVAGKFGGPRAAAPSHTSTRVGRPPKNASKRDEQSTSSLGDETAEGGELWICPVCSVAYVDGATDMIGCDGCDNWFHWNCVGLLVAPPENRRWFCATCAIARGVSPPLPRLPPGRAASIARPASSASIANGGRKRSSVEAMSSGGNGGGGKRRPSSSASNHTASASKKAR